MIGWIILAIIGLCIVVTCIRAAFFTAKRVETLPLPEEEIDEERAAKNLTAAIQIPTVSDPDEDKVDWAQFTRFHAFLEETYPRVAQTLAREVIPRASLLYRWKGTNPDLPPIGLLAHQDVVPAEETDWEHPAFSGHNDGEFIWGRGSVDMKNHLICVMEAVETLLEEGFTPERDVYLLFGHDEEVVGSLNAGAKSLCNALQARGVHQLESTLDEGGAMLDVRAKGIIEAVLAGIGISEKGYVDFEIALSAKGGHSSQPPKHSALGEMAGVIRDLERHQFRAKMLPLMSELLDTVGRRLPYFLRLVMVNHKLLRPVLLAAMKTIPFAACMIRTTTAVTQAQGSPAANVLPSRAAITANFRILPGMTSDDVERHIRKVVRNKNIEVKKLKFNEPSPVSSTEAAPYKLLKGLILDSQPGVIAAPFLVMGGTDSHYYNPICGNCYRYSPFLLDISLLLCTHAANERLPVAALGEGVRFFKRYIKKAAG